MSKILLDYAGLIAYIEKYSSEPNVQDIFNGIGLSKKHYADIKKGDAKVGKVAKRKLQKYIEREFGKTFTTEGSKVVLTDSANVTSKVKGDSNIVNQSNSQNQSETIRMLKDQVKDKNELIEMYRLRLKECEDKLNK